MNIHLVQSDVMWENHTANHAKVRAIIHEAHPTPGSLIVLPEMAFSGFSMNVAAVTQSDALEDEALLCEMAALHQSTIVGGIVSRLPDGRGANQAVAIARDRTLLARYTKLQPFSPVGESEHFPGGEEVVTFQWNGFQVSPFICYDLRFPEHFRTAVKLGAELFVVIANWPVKRHHHWLTLLQARAIENQAFVIGVNRCGTDPDNSYNGRSVVVSPHGYIIADAGEGEQVLSARINVDEVRQCREQFPALCDMR